jgi:hypothetical protein
MGAIYVYMLQDVYARQEWDLQRDLMLGLVVRIQKAAVASKGRAGIYALGGTGPRETHANARRLPESWLGQLNWR